MTHITIERAKLALADATQSAMTSHNSEGDQVICIKPHLWKQLREAIQALAAPTVQEPFGYLEIDDIESQREYPNNSRNVNLWHEGGEGMVAIYTTPPAQPAPVPLTPDQRKNLWVSATIELPSQENCYYRGLVDAEAYHGITKGQP